MRDWEQTIDSFIKRAAIAHAPSKLLAMHSAVPNASSRMVFQSRALSMQPGTDLGLDRSSISSHDSSSGTVSPAAQEQLLQTDITHQLLNLAAGVLEETDRALLSATATDDSVNVRVPMQRSIAPVSQVQTAVQHYEQLSGDQASDSPHIRYASAGVARHPRDLRGIMCLAPLVIPVVQTAEDQQQATASPSRASPGDIHRTAAGVKAADGPSKHQRTLPAVQGAAARTHAAIAAHQARLASSQQKGQQRHAYGFGSGAGHAQSLVAHHEQHSSSVQEDPDALSVQHSTASASRVSGPSKLRPALRKHSSVADLSSAGTLLCPRHLPPLRRFGSVSPASAAAMPPHGVSDSPVSSPCRQTSAVSIAQIMQSNSRWTSQAAEAYHSSNPLPNRQSPLSSPKRSVEQSLLCSPNRMSPLSSPVKSLDADQALRSLLQWSVDSLGSSESGSMSPSRHSPNR